MAEGAYRGAGRSRLYRGLPRFVGVAKRRDVALAASRVSGRDRPPAFRHRAAGRNHRTPGKRPSTGTLRKPGAHRILEYVCPHRGGVLALAQHAIEEALLPQSLAIRTNELVRGDLLEALNETAPRLRRPSSPGRERARGLASRSTRAHRRPRASRSPATARRPSWRLDQRAAVAERA